MFSATVAQKPTIAVSEGIKNGRNSESVWNLLGVESTGPNPPALLVIHHSSSTPTPSMNGAPMPSRNLMVSMPFQTTTIFSSQKEKKQIQMEAGKAAMEGERMPSMEWMACPPIHA